MPSYYFHLAFELHRQSAQGSETVSIGNDPTDSFIPPRNFNIFGSQLPSHQASTWASYIAPKRERRTSDNKRKSTGSGIDKTPRTATSRSASLKPSTNLTAHDNCQPTPTGHLQEKERTGRRGCSNTDWRFDKLTMESIEMELQKVDNSGKEEEPTAGTTGSSTPRGDIVLRGKYVPSNPRTTEFGWGVVHLYRDVAESPELSDSIKYGKESNKQQPVDIPRDLAFVDKQCTTLCVLAVPSYMTPSDLLGWLGEETREIVSHFRLVRSGRSNRYMVLLKFRSPKATKRWQKEWNGKLFNSTEPENCHVVFVKSIQFQAPDTNRDPSNFPDMSNDPFTPLVKPEAKKTQRTSTSLSARPAPPPTPALIELPTCPVCLERMDETTGLATIFCQHVFHCACLQKWRGSGCPVCRYTQNDPMHSHTINELEDAECKTCGSSANLWICLICGHLGCGRYESAHAFEHYEQTAHSYAMDVATQHVWDYTGDGYVHRLLQSSVDGKLFDLPSARASTSDTISRRPISNLTRTTSHTNNHATHQTNNTATTIDTTTTSSAIEEDEETSPSTDLLDTSPPATKLEQLSLDYTTLLTSQLASQRAYYSQQLDRCVDKASLAAADAAAATESLSVLTTQFESLQSAHSALVTHQLPALQASAARSERRAEKAEVVAKKMETLWREGESLSKGLMERIKFLEGQVEEEKAKEERMKEKLTELEEVNRDLSFFISATEKLRDGGEEVREGEVVVGEAPGGKGVGDVGGGGGGGTGAKKKRRKGKGRAGGGVAGAGMVEPAGGASGKKDEAEGGSPREGDEE